MSARLSVPLLAAALLVSWPGAGNRLVAQEPTADQVKELLAKYRTERDETKAGSVKFPAEAFAAAEKAAARAEASEKAGDLKAAARLARDARWQLPAVPADLPPHVRLVIGAVRLRHADRVNALAYSPDGTKLASASRDGSVRVWDIGNGRELLAYRGHPAPPPVSDANPVEGTSVLRVPAVAWSPTGTLVASAGGNEIHLWDPATGKLAKTLKKHTRMARALAFSSDGSKLASAGDDRLVVIWDVATGKDAFATQAGSRPEAIAYSPNGKLVAVAAAG
jgi:WD40 repeat protein